MLINIRTFAICLMLCFALVHCQRPSYAGSRPPNGHKDKYRPTKNPPNTFELTNRFSDNALENGATQRPPQGVLVVNAEPTFIPIKNNSVKTSFEFKENETNTNKSESGSSNDVSNRSGSVSSSSKQGSSNPTVVHSRLPLDAHGDQQLIDHISRLPIDNQPFWFINYQAIEAHRNGSGNNFGPIASRSSFLGK